ncbi:single-stranded-DNA-specific exonuclease RecJ [Candidatus Woesebacteria bacterium RIFCSPHIGHO2_01_FULL_38_9]|uniref:Single-stranded-DNA-specific exonuclease RecJ n=2 Tax=Candidatus Woeseibacteriota TaxID=1752722 RepID=A0A1F7XZ44_9BACT|nr:MAG: single-stranded-DNA-specific exonuclease RecJ [Candidatus Woesebacteria bacterium RIFCSPHIGHO2_01_FULL_38_9]OGM58840.1 MAG: single-stranded-DNA-specific exonuclease RecJ [Candidatus Woesebacteria bacterium RIFCSPLOWO2_01_FULL_39_10]
MKNNSLKWEVLHKSPVTSHKSPEIIDILLENRGLNTKKQKDEFFNPTDPKKIELKELGISDKSLKKAIKRIKKAIDKDEHMIIYGDYDADGVCATAILWECLYSLTKNVQPYIPDRFTEGYGMNADTISKLKSENSKLRLIVTVDNGIVANEAIDCANELGIDVIVADHHLEGKKLPKAHSIIHTTKICGSAIAWIFSREINKKLITSHTLGLSSGRRQSPVTNLELAAIGTIADQMPLLGPNRSFAKHGLEALNKTKRPGLIALFEEAALIESQTRLRQKASARQVGTYEVNFVIAPRINAMGRMEHAIDSLRLLCTTNKPRANELARHLAKTNRERQRIVDEIVLHARNAALKIKWRGAIILVHESYHEGVIGLAASKLVEEFYRPSIVISKGSEFSKASARSISGINIIELINKVGIIEGGGGHPMAAGFTIKTEKIEKFIRKFDKATKPYFTEDVLHKKLKIDSEIDFEAINLDLWEVLKKFEPTGIGNPRPCFATKQVNVASARVVGGDGKHLKLNLEKQGVTFEAIGFGIGNLYVNLSSTKPIDVAYTVDENIWNGNKKLQLKIKDMKLPTTLRSGYPFGLSTQGRRLLPSLRRERNPSRRRQSLWRRSTEAKVLRSIRRVRLGGISRRGIKV